MQWIGTFNVRNVPFFLVDTTKDIPRRRPAHNSHVSQSVIIILLYSGPTDVFLLLVHLTPTPGAHVLGISCTDCMVSWYQVSNCCGSMLHHGQFSGSSQQHLYNTRVLWCSDACIGWVITHKCEDQWRQHPVHVCSLNTFPTALASTGHSSNLLYTP